MKYKLNRLLYKTLLLGAIVGWMAVLIWCGFPVSTVHAQQPTGSIPTVTGTPAGPVVTVYTDQNVIGVYSGPSSFNYDQIGILMAGEKAYALGYSPDKNWIEIVYYGVPDAKGWIYALFVSITPGSLPVLSLPATPTPRTTPTIDPTYVAAYGLSSEPTHLPTFTAPAPIKLPTFAPFSGTASKVPFGLLILGLALIGILGAVISFLRGGR